jgi:ABC-type Co2+ transport system permease subunit
MNFFFRSLYYNNIMDGMFDFSELVKRALKYLIEGFMVAIAAYAIPKQSLKMEEVIVIALTAAATFAVLDVFVPTMASSARGGAGFGIGANLVGFPGGL